MSAGLQVSFPGAPAGASAGTSGTTLRPTSGGRRGSGGGSPARTSVPRPKRAPRKDRGWKLSLNHEDWLIAAMLMLALAIATSAAAADGSTAARAVAAPAEASAPSTPASAAPSGTGCTVKDPTGGRCVTPTTAHALDELAAVFGSYRGGPTIKSAGCWNAHPWNPRSDHPLGKACDLFPGASGKYATGAALDAGWAVAKWLRQNSGALGVHYVIWQGRIWSIEHPNDVGGWGRPYASSVYDVTSATGGHFDHVHVSFQR